MPDSSPEPAYMTVSAHIEQLGLSRARFYDLVGEAFFLPPIYLLSNRRPVYTADMAQRNTLAKMVGIGVLNGAPKVFYRPRRRRADASPAEPRRTRRASPRERGPRNDMGTIVAALRSLGLQSVDEDAVAQVLADLFPGGTDGIEHGDIIRTVYRRLRQAEGV